MVSKALDAPEVGKAAVDRVRLRARGQKRTDTMQEFGFVDRFRNEVVRSDFDGAFQHVNLEAGEHQLEIRAPGLAPITFDVVVQPGRTITLRADY